MEPWRIGTLFVTDGEAGFVFITTFVADDWELQLFTEVVKLYVPAFIELILFITGFCNAEVKPLGPVQL